MMTLLKCYCLILIMLSSAFTFAQDTLRIGWAGSPDSLNPGVAVLVEAFTVFDLAYDSMFSIELDGSFKPELAKSWSVSEDGLVWTFKIHTGVNFHDGTPLRAQDVAFSYLFYQAHEDFPFLSGYTNYFENVEAADDETVVITLSEPLPNMENQLYLLYILPEHIWSAYSEDSAALEFENLDLIGSGPFELVDYKQGEYLHFKSHKDHYLYPPHIDEVIFQTFSSQDVLVQALKTGQVDMITEMPNTAVISLRNDPNVALVSGAPLAPSLEDIIFNVIDPENCPEDDGICSGHPALLDVTLRQALAHATDKQQLIDVVLLGLGTPGLGLVPDSLGDWFNSDLEDYAFDVELANHMLDEAGYKDSDKDGIREMADGKALSFRLNWPNDSLTAPRTAELLGQMWGDVGISLMPQALDPDALTSVCCPSFDFDIILWGWTSDPDPGFLLSILTTDEIPTGTSETGYSNPEYDALFAEAVELDLKTP
ncbi:MAG: ABC transporter substrate-binding protein [Deinococcales bacterium]